MPPVLCHHDIPPIKLLSDPLLLFRQRFWMAGFNFWPAIIFPPSAAPRAELSLWWGRKEERLNSDRHTDESFLIKRFDKFFSCPVPNLKQFYLTFTDTSLLLKWKFHLREWSVSLGIWWPIIQKKLTSFISHTNILFKNAKLQKKTNIWFYVAVNERILE